MAKPEIEIPPGVTSVQRLCGHTDSIGRIAFSPDGRLLASSSADETILLWDFKENWTLRELEGHSGTVTDVAFDPQGHRLASGSHDRTVRLWDTDRDRLLHTLEGHTGWVFSVAFDPSSRTLASTADDNTVRLWDADSGRLIRTLEGHSSWVVSVAFDPRGGRFATASTGNGVWLWNTDSGQRFRRCKGYTGEVFSVAFDPQGRTIAGAAGDSTVRLWETDSGRLLRTLEGHTKAVVCVAFLPDGRLLASKSTDNTIRLWSTKTGACLAVIPEATGDNWSPGLCFHPSQPRLATVCSSDYSWVRVRDREIHIWELDFERLLGQAVPVVSYTSARIVIVGDSWVGKTGLGWRMAHGKFKHHPSTHGQQFWLLDELRYTRDDGTHCEAVLWDLAGQPDYRLIHALFLDDADLALVLFDPTDSRDPLHGVEFWLKQLSAGRVGNLSKQSKEEDRLQTCPTLLIAARCDRGTGTLTKEELDAFCQQHGIRDHLSTSAQAGDGVAELVERIKELIDWDHKPTTVTTDTFKRIKDYVLALKESSRRRKVIVTPDDLRRRLKRTDKHWTFTDDEMMTAVGHLENHGYVKWLRISSGETRILLSPELLNNLAASFVLEARRNVKGLGSLEEQRLFDDQYPFAELAGMAQDARAILLDSATLLFLEHHVCFREISPLTRESYLVFPELINQKRPSLDDQRTLVEGAGYTLSGAVENVYASLVVLLGFTQTFTRTNQWRNEARYEIGDGLICGFRQETDRGGELDLILYFGADVGQPVRTLFQGLFESFLARRNLTVYRYEPVVCPKCDAVLERAVVRAKSRKGKIMTFCNDCGKKLTLSKLDEPIQLTHEQQTDVQTQRGVADQRSLFEQAVFSVLAHVDEGKIPRLTCFVSYAWGDREHERWVERSLATDLQKAGIDVVLDRWENAKIGASISRFVDRIGACDRVIVVGTPNYRDKCENKNPGSGYVVAAEFDVISNRILGTEAEKETVLPVLFAGDRKASFPSLLQGRVHADFRDPEQYFLAAFDLILSLYDIPPQEQAVADLRDQMVQTF